MELKQQQQIIKEKKTKKKPHQNVFRTRERRTTIGPWKRRKQKSGEKKITFNNNSDHFTIVFMWVITAYRSTISHYIWKEGATQTQIHKHIIYLIRINRREEKKNPFLSRFYSEFLNIHISPSFCRLNFICFFFSLAFRSGSTRIHYIIIG